MKADVELGLHAWPSWLLAPWLFIKKDYPWGWCISCYVASTCIHSGSGQIEGTPGPLVLNTWSDCCGMGTENFALKMLQLGVQLWLKPA